MNKASELARAAIAALAESLEREGLSAKPKDLQYLLSKALEDHSGTLIVTISTPTGSSGELAEKVRKVMKEKTGKEIEVIDRKDSSIIGGVVISFGDERIDLSIKRALQDALNILSPTT